MDAAPKTALESALADVAKMAAEIGKAGASIAAALGALREAAEAERERILAGLPELQAKHAEETARLERLKTLTTDEFTARLQDAGGIDSVIESLTKTRDYARRGN
jgi:hypothetical protein